MSLLPLRPAVWNTDQVGRLLEGGRLQFHRLLFRGSRATWLDLFEARCGDQVHRFYDGLMEHNRMEPDASPSIDDPPF